VCNDSGPMHMAVALGKPVTAIIGPTNPHRTGPYRRPEGVVRSGVDCGGCLRRVCNRVPKDQPSLCMQKISPEQVLENLRTQMG